MVLAVTAYTVVQGVVQATDQVNGRGQISTPCGSETLKQISMKLGICNYFQDVITHANLYGAATTWVVSANSQVC